MGLARLREYDKSLVKIKDIEQLWRGRLYIELQTFEAIKKSLKKVEDKLGSGDCRQFLESARDYLRPLWRSWMIPRDLRTASTLAAMPVLPLSNISLARWSVKEESAARAINF